MDAAQPSNRYMGSSHPPSVTDPQYQQQQQGFPHPPPPSHWYNQAPPPPPPHSHYQYSHHHPPPPPLPPHPQQQQWQPSPSPPPYPPHTLPPYTAHPHLYASPRPSLHVPPPPPQQQHQQPYPPQLNQVTPHSLSFDSPPMAGNILFITPLATKSWGNPNFVRHQGWEHPDRNVLHGNEEDWAARARAWAAAKAASENQHAPSQFTPISRIEDHNHAYNDQYQLTVDPHLTDIQKSSLPVSSSPQVSVPVTNPHRSSSQVLPESGSSSYVSDVPSSYSGRDGARYSVSPSQGSVILNSSIYQQEVPSSYSTIPGHGGFGSQNEKFHTPLPPSLLSHQEPQPQSRPPPVPATGRSSMEQLQVMHQDCSAESAADVHNQSDFEHGPHQPANYLHPDPAGVVGGMEHVAVASSMHSWTTGTAVTPGAAFPPMPPHGPQFDLPPPVPGHTTPMFGRIGGPGFRPGIAPVGPAFGVSTGTALHSSTVFQGDTNEVFSVSERPKKASVPNWLREEIIKKKAVIVSTPIQDQPTEDSFNSVGAEGDEKAMRRSDQVDNKSSDSARSNEEEEDDEDDVEAARTAAINQEIKRILTEVLLKVTDELFDEIATKVLSEDDLMVEVENGDEPVNHKVSLPLTVSTPKASTEVLIPIKVKKNDNDAATEKSTSSTPGDVLGLANYASDDDDDGEESSHPTKQANGTTHKKSDDTSALELVPEAEERGTSGMPTEVSNGVEGHLQSSAFRNSTNLSFQSSMSDVPRKGFSHAENELTCDGGSQVANEGLENPRDHVPVETGRIVGFPHQHAESSDSNDNFKRKDLVELKSGHGIGNAINEKPLSGGSQVREARSRSAKEEKHESKRSSVGKDSVQEASAIEVKANQKHSDSGVSKKGSGRDARNERGADERNNSSREKGKAWESESRSSHGDKKDARKETEKAKPVNGKEDSNRKRDRRRDEMEDRSRHRDERDTHRYKRRHSPSVGSRAKDSKENSLVSHGSASDDETSENSRRRKSRSNRRSLSRSPTRSRRRQVSRSPHSKRSQRRHSPYSSHEDRGRRSRSGTPMRPRR